MTYGSIADFKQSSLPLFLLSAQLLLQHPNLQIEFHNHLNITFLTGCCNNSADNNMVYEFHDD